MNRLTFLLFFWSLGNVIFSMEELENHDNYNAGAHSQFIFFEKLAPELQAHILLFTCYQSESLFRAIKFINNLKQVNINFLELVNSKYITKKFVRYLYSKYRTQIKENILGFDRLILFYIMGISDPERAGLATQNNNLELRGAPLIEHDKQIEKNKQMTFLETLDSIELELQLVNQEKRVGLSKILSSIYILSLLKTAGSKAILKQKIQNHKVFINEFFVLCCSLFNSEKAVNETNLNLIKTLLDYGIDVDYINLAGSTGLIKAAAAGNIDLVQVLLDYNADPNLGNKKSGFTVLMTAISSWIYHLQFAEDEAEGESLGLKSKLVEMRPQNFKAIIQLLVQKGADPNRENSKKLSAQILANLYKRAVSSNEKKIDFSASIDDAFKRAN